MNILFDINHPAHVHLFKNAIKTLETKGHHVIVTARDKDVTLQLLESYQIPHILLSKAQKGYLGLGIELIKRQWKLFPILRKNKIDVCVSATGACSVHVCKLLGIPSLVFYDTEHAKIQNALTISFATRFMTPDSFQRRYGKKHLTYNSLHELAYLHPKYFSPDPNIFELLRMPFGSKFVFLRFVSWNAAHDVGQKGLSLNMKRKIIQICSQYARVIISSEAQMDAEFEEYRFAIAPEKMHDVLYYAEMCISEGGTTATEAAILGTPSIHFSSTGKYCGVFKDLEKNYDLLHVTEKEDDLLQKVGDLFSQDNLKANWQLKREKLLENKVSLTDYLLNRIEETFNEKQKNIAS